MFADRVGRLLLAAVLSASAASPAFSAAPASSAGGAPPLYTAPSAEPAEGPSSGQADKPFGVEGGASSIRYYDFDLTAATPLHAAVRSAFVPGWGQFFNGQRVKGTVMFITAAAALGGSLSLWRSANRTYDDYKAKGVADDAAYDTYQRRWTQSAILGGAAAGIWIYSIVDAYRNAYSSLYTTQRQWDVVPTSDGAAVVWRREFR